jgi:hypothetical protein
VSMGRVLKWLYICDSTHKACKLNGGSFFPSRLINVTEIQRGSMKGVRLINSYNGQSGRYVCLSHCWGKAPNECCTRVASYSQRIDFIEDDLFSKNFQDAITLTRRLGVKYIWIDSLCIIQDDSHNWKIESAKIADIYRFAYLTIAASWSADSTGGCSSIAPPNRCLSLSDRAGRSLLFGARVCGPMSWKWNLTDAKKQFPLHQRSWVFQERLISTRIVYCDYGELSFECLEAKQCECGNTALFLHVFPAGLKPETQNNHRFLMAKSPLLGFNIFQDWRSMVSSYMLLNITKMSDILPAISGCARVISELTGDQYLAGSWRKSLYKDLLCTIGQRQG